ncbi:erythrose-4-phosphate dehydrogenase [Oceaniserpentilla sp. 4NH20-0058]|uniref:type I glyceraldehyde-3-phosphate dehydrogenase n=1 Tax=Oceaniserpentilla sp. 4NH20-0058 TaxID=3127660 RepID=UPI00310ACEDC
MSLRIAINGFGRIGRCVLRSIYERNLQNDIQVVAINELADCETISYMLRYDSTHGRFPFDVSVANDVLTISDGKGVKRDIKILHEHEIETLPWHSLNVDAVLECTGQFKNQGQLQPHLQRGAKKVLLSQPGESDVDFTLIAGVNHNQLLAEHKIVSVGSCSTNCVLPVMQILDEHFGIESGVSTTIHSAMNDQPVIDAYSSDLRRTRAAVASIIPVDTALPKGIARIMPHLEDCIESLHLRVPTLNVSAMDLTLQLKTKVTAENINTLLQQRSLTDLNGLIGFTNEPHASVDFNHDARSGIVDGTQTRVSGERLLKLLIWFDNEWGFANRMVDALQQNAFKQNL